MSSSSYTLSRRQSPPSLVVAAARCAIQGALRPFLRRKGIAFIAILHVGEGTSDYYRRAASSLIRNPVPVDEDCNEIAIVMTLPNGPTDARAIYDSFRYGRQIVIVAEGSILFVDEFDSFGDREGDDDHARDYRRQVINGMLECLDPVEGREGVIVVGATNNPSVIDRALLRPGRLETLIEIPLPDAAARVAILRHHLHGQAFENDLARYVSASRGWSGADIEKLARDARRLSRRRKVALSEDLLLEVMPARYVLSDGELRNTAVHEAGHAIVAVVLACDVLKHVHIDRDAAVGVGAQSVGRTVFEPELGRVKTASYYDDRIAMLLGGIAAETVVYGCHADGAGGAPSSDLVVASDIATKLERHYGFGEVLSVELGKGDRPLEYLRDRDPELRSLVDGRLKTQLDRAVALLSDRRQELDQLAETLFETGHVVGDEVRALLGGKPRGIESASVRT